MNLSELSIEDLAELRDRVISQLNDRVIAGQRELQGEIDRLGGRRIVSTGKTIHIAPQEACEILMVILKRSVRSGTGSKRLNRLQ